MRLDSLGSALSSAVSAPLTTDPVDQMQRVAQVSVLKKALQTESDTVRELIAAVTQVGQNLDVKG